MKRPAPPRRSPPPPAPPPASAPPEAPAPRWLPAAVAALVILFVTLAVLSMVDDSQTSDEAIHLAAGFAHLTRADFAVNPEHPPLAKEIAALPLLFLDVSLPVNDPSWREAHASAFQLPLGERFVYHNGVPFRTILTAGRAPIVALGALLCLTVFFFSRSLSGWRAALVSLALCALDPNVLAHARLVTTDLAVSLFLLLTLFFLRRWLVKPSWTRAVLTGAAAGLTLASKFSAVVVAPAVLAAMLFDAARPRPRAPREGPAGAAAGAVGLWPAFAVMMAVAAAVLAATYAFTGLASYVTGLKGVFTTVTGGTEAYLLGAFSTTGWWYYYPVAMLLKTPVPTLVLFALIPLGCAGARGRGLWKDHMVLVAPLALFAAASLAAARNVGLRHVLPLYPILFVLAGRTVTLLWPARGGRSREGPAPRRAMARRAAAVALGLWLAASTLWIHPSYLAYFNELGGGPSNGWRLLSDSNIDWGQDFIRLKRFMEARGAGDIILGYYGNQDPAYYGIDWQYLPSAGHMKAPPSHVLASPRPLLAISAMTLQGMFLPDKAIYRWLQDRRPVGQVGYSIFVYDLTGDRDACGHLADLYARYQMPAQAAWARGRCRE